MKRFYYLIFVLSVLITTSTYAQVSGYSFSSFSGTYTEITGGTVLGTGTIDDNSYNANNIGFTFNYNGTNYTDFSVNANGFLALGASVSSSYYALSSGSSNNVIAAFNADLQGNTGGELSYQLSGTSPNQVLTIQWKDFRHYAATSESYNFQVKLYETTNNIEVVYGTIIKNATNRTRQVGLRGSSSNDFNNRTTTTNWAASTAGTTNSASMTLTQTVYPASGLTFAWFPPVALDMGAFALASPGTIGCYGTSETVTITIKNYGTTTIDFSVNSCTVSASVTGPNPTTFTPVVLNSGTLASGATQDVVVSTSYNMSAAGTYTFNASTSVTGDGNTANDAMAPANRTVVAPVSLPRSVDFTGFTGANLTTVFPNWYEAAGTSPAGTTSLWISQTGLGYTGNITARINLYTTTRNEWIVGPKFTAAATTVLKFKAAVTDWNSIVNPDVMGSDDKVRVMISTDCGVSWSSIYQLDATSGLTTALTEFTVPLGSYAGNDIIIAFYATDGPVDDLEDYDFHLDDIYIGDPPTCPAPTALTATNITTTSADLGWTETGSATTWDIELGPFGFTPTGTPTQAGVTSNPYTYTGLSPATQYSFYVRADCGGTKEDTSPWVGPYSFTTLCVAVTALNENFDAVTPPAFPSCWKKVGTSGSASTQTTNPNSTPNCLYIFSSSTTSLAVVSMPPLSNAGAGTHQLRFQARANFTVGGVIQVGYLTDPSDASTFVKVDSIVAGALTYQQYTLILGTAPGSNQILAFRHSGSPANSVLIDDVIWEPLPSCPAPTGLTATNITTTSADLGWTENGSATTWDIELGPFGFTPTGTPTQAGVTSNPYTYTGLSPATQYSFYVRADCGGTKEDTSPWAGPYSFTTECGTLSLPYSQSFDDVTFPPVCWSTFNNGSGNNWLRTTSSPYAGAGAMYYPYNYSNPANAWAFTPGFNLTSGVKYRVTFWQKVSSASYPENLKVTVGSDQTVGSQTTTILDLPNLTNTTYTQRTADFVCPSTGTYYFAFNCYSDADMWNLYVDEVNIDVAPEFIDAEVTAILSPASMETLGATVTPQVTVKNNSDNTKNVPVITEIWKLPPQSKPIEISAKSSETIVTNIPYSRADVIEIEEKSNKELSFKFTIPENPNKFIETGELLSQNFNDVSTFPPTGWTRIQNNTNLNGNHSCYWDTLTLTYNSPSASAGVWWDYYYQDEWLISPPVTLSGSPTGTYNLKWYYYGFRGSTNGDHYYTKISTDNGSTWTVLYDLTAQTGGWNYWVEPVEIDITAYAGQTIKVAFHAEDPVTNDGLWYVWFVDDVQIGYGPAMVYRDSVMVSSLGSGSSTNPTFANWIADPTGNYLCKAYTVIAGDIVPGNDLMTKNFKVVTTLNLTALIEGRYNSGSMVPDTVTVAIHNSSSPYTEVGSAYTVLNSSGVGTAFINAGANAVNYYIVVKHRNALETWSSSTPQFSGGVMSYDFTTASTQAYGDNMKLKGTKWCFFSGDIQTQDGLIDLSDVLAIINDANAFLSGTALLTDLTGDDSVDLSDVLIAVNNSNAFVSVITP